jgi:hypothetical protein
VVGTAVNVVYVSVSNPANEALVGTVAVQAVVAGLSMTVSAQMAVAAGSTVVVPVLFPQAPSRVIGCSRTTEGVDPY